MAFLSSKLNIFLLLINGVLITQEFETRNLRSNDQQDSAARSYYPSNFKRIRRGYGPRDDSQFSKFGSYSSDIGGSDSFGTFRKDSSGRKGGSRNFASRSFPSFGGPDAFLVAGTTVRTDTENKESISFPGNSNPFSNFPRPKSSWNIPSSSKGRSKGGSSKTSHFGSQYPFDSGSSLGFGSSQTSSGTFGSSSSSFGSNLSKEFSAGNGQSFYNPFNTGGRSTGRAGFSSGNSKTYTSNVDGTFPLPGGNSYDPDDELGLKSFKTGNAKDLNPFGNFGGKITDLTGGEIVGPLKNFPDLNALLEQLGPEKTTKKPIRVLSLEDRNKIFSGDSLDEQSNEDSESFSSPRFPDKMSSSYKGYKKGKRTLNSCQDSPRAPQNGALKCTSYSGCILDCNPNFQTREGDTRLFLKCIYGKWVVSGSESTNIPDCEPICNPPCQNAGICLQPYTCVCPDDWEGPQCDQPKETKIEQCVDKPPIPVNSKVYCMKEKCVAKCIEGYQFENDLDEIDFVCQRGKWTMKNTVTERIPNCQPICDPACQNGGICLAPNLCECTKDYRGHECQYPISNCDPKKMNFNGGYNCSGIGEIFGCKLWCPGSVQFNSAPADLYKCDYSTSRWSPSLIPKCQYSYLHQTPDPFGPVVVKSFAESLEPTSGMCFTWSGSHYKSFDGKVFSFECDCPYTLLQDAALGTFSVNLIPEENCSGRKCPRNIKIFTEGDQYILKNSGKDEPILTYGDTTLIVPGQVNGLISERVAHFVVLKMLGIGLTLKWDLKDLIVTEVSEQLWNRTSGLCGRLDGSMKNDFSYADGSAAENLNSFLKTWRANTIHEVCSDSPRTRNSCTKYEISKTSKLCMKLKKDPRFETCRQLVDVDSYIETCQWDYCNCELNPESCACDSFAAFFRECTNKGGAVEGGWRFDNLCAMECSEQLVYKSCMPAIQARCGQATESTKPDFCVEGCDCIDGLVLNDEGKCVEPSNCPCTYHNKTYSAGDTIPNDCNSCACVFGEWVCTEVKCGSRCSSVGDPHYTSFDGKQFDFMGQCSYYLVKGPDFSIEAENVACAGAISEQLSFPASLSSKFPSCTKSLTVRVPGTTVYFKQGRQVIINGEEITELPLWAHDLYIKRASSLFLTAYLPNGIEVWWDGQTRVYIDAPAELRGKTEGLCGTFTDNQKDDFLSPEGDIELNTIAFANKWKTSEKCADVNILHDPTSPCERHVQNKQIAEKLCSKLRKEYFSNCHLTVDLEPFYRNCMYDVCSCETSAKDCMCPILASYGVECAQKGITLDWRSKVKECGLHCTGGQTYQMCGDSCAHTCFDIATNPSCKRKCVEGCNCPKGFSLDAKENCVPLNQCPCIYQGKEYKPSYEMFQKNNNDVQELCKCERGMWQCREPSDLEMQSPEFFSELQFDCAKFQNETYTDCMPEEEINCLTMHVRPEKISKDLCRPGCRCKNGFVRDKVSKQCIPASSCPCHHGAKSYQEGDTIIVHCNTCTCQDSLWSCTNKECSSICTAWGSSHYKTFDGRIFDFNGMCDYMLAKGKKSRSDHFEISVQNVPCGTNGVTCAKTLTLRIGSGNNQEVVQFSRNKPIDEGKNLTRTIIREAGLFVIAEVTDMGLELQWDKGTRAYIILSSSWKGQRIQGLCGNYNGNEKDDLTTPSGGLEVSTKLFGDSWRLQKYCPESVIIKDTCAIHPERKTWATEKCAILRSSVFFDCHVEVPVEPYLERCLFDSCGCDTGGDCECLCTAIATYAQECNIQGVYVRWRTPDMCPMQCDESCEHYEPCISTCPFETCDSYKEPSSTLCRQDTCIEGCAKDVCLPGTVHKNASSKECVPIEECQNVCLEIDGKVFIEGDIVSEDDCHTCYCTKSKKICRGIPCETTTEAFIDIPRITLPITSPSPESKNCRNGWTDWLNQDRPLFYKKNSDIETIPKRIRKSSSLHGFCKKSLFTNIRCRTVGDHKEPAYHVTCQLEDGLQCIGKNSKSKQLCKDYEISFLCDCSVQVTSSTVTTPPKLVTPPSVIVLPRENEIQTNCEEEGWTTWFNGHYPSELGEFETLDNVRETEIICPDYYIKDFECRPVVGGPADKNTMCSKAGAVCRNNAGHRYCKDYEFRVFCQCKCQDALGIEDGRILIDQISVSSSQNDGVGRLNSNSPWVLEIKPHEKLSNSWIQIDLLIKKEVTGVVTQGHPDYPGFISAFAIQVSESGSEWKEIQNLNENFAKTFKGNFNSFESVTNLFPEPVYVRYVRIIPLKAENTPALRFELKGCDLKEETVSLETTVASDYDSTLKPLYSCNDGWTHWMNSHTPSPGDWNDIENYKSLRLKYSFCEETAIKRVECRIGVTKESIENGPQNDIVCNRNLGLQCISDLQVDHCFDYEIRFYCDCSETSQSEGTIFTTTEPSVTIVTEESCIPDPIKPTKPHETNCQQFYECRLTVLGGERVLKTCGPGTLYNPSNLVCDWPASVYVVRPECKDDHPKTFTTQHPESNYTDVRTATPTTSPRMYKDYACPSGSYYEEYAIQCTRVCIYYRQFLMQQGRCLEDEEEAPACVEDVTGEACPDGFFLRNNSTCVSISNCNCMLPNGMSAPPERSFLVSDCEICKCSENEMTCDNSRCVGRPKEFECLEWSPWFSVSTPSGEGDNESLGVLQRYHPDVCSEPTDIECRVKKSQFPYYMANQKVICNNRTGFVCKNKNNPGGCKDYEVRIICPCDDEPKTKAFTSTTALPLKPKPTLPPPLPGCFEPFWTEWFNVTHPYKKGGDYELLDVIAREGFDICPKEYITEIECAFYKTTQQEQRSSKWKRGSRFAKGKPSKYTTHTELVDYTESDDIYVTCSKFSGLTCVNCIQPNKKKCEDYAIRVYCHCAASDIFKEIEEEETHEEDIDVPYPGWPIVGPECDDSKIKKECAIPCIKACHHYEHYLKLSGKCRDESECTSACMDPLQSNPCPEGQFMSDNSTCTDVQDCSCRLNSGLPLPGGMRIQVSRCEWCSCKNNVLLCNKDSICKEYESQFTTESTPSVIYGQSPTPMPTRTVPPPLPNCDSPYWTDWFNVTHPHMEDGDYELIDNIDRESLSLCPKEYISEIECAFYKTTRKPIKSSKRKGRSKGRFDSKYTTHRELVDYTESEDIYVTCSKFSGLTCVNNLQPNNKKCEDYSIRVYCQCEPNDKTEEEKYENIFQVVIVPYPGWPIVGPECDYNKIKMECALPCTKVCHYYEHFLKISGECQEESDCVSACMDLGQIDPCPVGQFMSDNSTCVDVQDCSCRLKSGIPLPGGLKVQTSKCEWCTCKNNVLICTKESNCDEYKSYITTVYTPSSYESTTDSYSEKTDVSYPNLTTLEAWVTEPTEIRFTTIQSVSLIKIRCNQWTPWMNMKRTSEGDFQRIVDLRAQYEELCEVPVNISCRDAIAKLPYEQLDQSVTCSVTEGLICRNEENRGDCYDYEVSLFCQCDDDFTPEPSVIPETTETNSQTVPCEVWSPWINDHKPWLENGDSEYKTLSQLQEQYSFCTEGHIGDIECEEAASGLDVSVNNDVMCDKQFGLRCRNENQEKGVCFDFKIRYFCSCGTTVTVRPTLIVPLEPTSPTTCDPADYINLLEFVPDSSFSATSSAGSSYAPPNAARLNSNQSKAYPGGAWIPAIMDKKQYLQIDLGEIKTVYGFYIAGSSRLSRASVTSFTASSSDNQIMWSPMSPTALQGSLSSGKTTFLLLPTPVDARWIRLMPKTWADSIALRVEVVGCSLPTPISLPKEEECVDEMGLENGALSDEQISVSSVYEDLFEIYGKHNARLNKQPINIGLGDAWVAKPLPDQFIRFNFLEPRKLSGVVVQGSELSNEFVESFSVRYSPDGKIWNSIVDKTTGKEKIFSGNYDSKTAVTNEFDRLIEAQYLELKPIEWFNGIAMRVEIKGCYEPYPPIKPKDVPTTVAPTKAPPSYCEMCKGVPEKLYGMCYPCPSSMLFNGSRCVSPLQCPCFYKNRTYKRGSLFETNDCQQCSCEVDGVVKCKEKICDKCDIKDERPIMTPTCDCICKPCQENTTLCSSSGLCIEKEKWCDGIEHCAEDEIDCPKLPTKECPLPYCPEEWEVSVESPGDAVNCPIYKCKPPEMTTSMNCPPPFCPFGFDIVLVPKKMGEACPSYECKAPSTTSEPYTCPPPTCPSGYDVQIGISFNDDDGCPQYKCSTNAPPTAPCPPPSCPLGYDVTYSNAMKDVLSLCPPYNCQPIVTTTVCPPVECPRGLQTMFIKADDNANCPQYTCVKITRPALVTTPLPTASQCPEVVLPVCGPREEIYQANPHDPCPVFKCKTIGAPPPTDIPLKDMKSTCKNVGKRFTTFDGTEFQANTCKHIMARDKIKKSWQISNLKTCNGISSCVMSLNVTIKNSSIILHSNMSVQWEGYSYTPEQAEKIGDSTNLFSISKVGDSLVLNSVDHQFEVILDSSSNSHIELSNDLMYQVDGLCGLYSGSPVDDRTKPDGSLSKTIKEFENSWLMDEENCQDEPKICNTEESKESFMLCNALDSKPFTECHDVIPPASYLKGCVDRLCLCLKENKTKEVCKCGVLSSYISSCLEKKPDAKISDWRIASKCYKECPTGEIYNDCYKPSCEKSCNNIKSPDACVDDNKGICVSGCFCKPGLVRKKDTCVPPEQCRNCICESYGDSHYMSSDRKNFTMSAECTFVAARDIDPLGEHQFQILVTNEECEFNSATMCAKNLKILTAAKNEVNIKVNAFGEMTVIKDNVILEDSYIIESWLTMERPDEEQVKVLLSKLQVEILYSKENFGFEIKAPSHLFGGKLEGLCGNCNSDPNDDLMSAEGQIEESLEEFGLSWSLDSENCEIKEKKDTSCRKPDDDPCLLLFDKQTFGECHPIEDPAPYVHSCQLELCSTNGSQDVACNSFTAYAKRCQETGVCLQYRTDELCPKTCPDTFQYYPCGKSCVKTCKNYEELNKDSSSCLISSTPGCYCPDGMVADNEKCVNETNCITCDQEGHRMGDIWKTDDCTTCECNNDKGAICHTIACPIDPICHEGYTLEEVGGSFDECCGIQKVCKVIILTNCTEPEPPVCDYGKKPKLIEAPGICPEYICVCLDPKDCPSPDKSKELKAGEMWVLETKGCCPKYVTSCTGECPKPNCQEFYEPVIKEVDTPQCCEEFTCKKPKDACIFEPRFKIKNGSEIPLQPTDERIPKLYQLGDQWLDGLCIESECFLDQNNKTTIKYLKKTCQNAVGHSDEKDYELIDVPQANECCPKVIRKSCIVNGSIVAPNTTYTDPTNGCRSVECKENENKILEKVEQNSNCDENCPPGWKYYPSPAAPIVCCGQCQQVSCEYQGIIREVGETWTSSDFCTEFECIRSVADNKIRTRSKDVQCLKPSAEDQELYTFTKVKKEGQCCVEYTKEKCRFLPYTPGLTMEDGEEKQDPINKCMKVLCERKKDGSLNRKEIEQVCTKTCPLGQEYMPPTPRSNECCGVCLQTQCVDNKKVHRIGDTWENPKDICYQYTCRIRDDDLTVVAIKRECPYFPTDCPKDKILRDTTGCCKICNVTRETKKECEPEIIAPEDTIKLFVLKARTVGRCVNPKPVSGFKRCRGQCDSKTVFKAKGIEAKHVSVCSCCRPSRMSRIEVALHCNRGGYNFTRAYDNIEACECQPCEALQRDQYSNDESQKDLTDFNPPIQLNDIKN